jgi:hypothetical protein
MTLFCTLAIENMTTATDVDATVQSVQLSLKGQAEHRVVLDPK